MNKDKIILDLCGGTGAWSEPYVDAGYVVFLLTLPDVDITEVYHRAGALYIPGCYNEHFSIPLNAVHGILAAPPCTEFSLAKGSAPRDFEGAMKIVRACMDIIWACRAYGGLKFWAMENPCGFLRQFIGKPAYTFEQWQFGANAVKKTDLWGYFNAPKPSVKVQPANIVARIGHRSNARDWGSLIIPEEYKHLNLDRAAARAITPAGFAQAFFKANK